MSRCTVVEAEETRSGQVGCAGMRCSVLAGPDPRAFQELEDDSLPLSLSLVRSASGNQDPKPCQPLPAARSGTPTNHIRRYALQLVPKGTE